MWFSDKTLERYTTGGVPQENQTNMTTIKNMTEHMELDSDRIKELISLHDINLSDLTTDQARLEIIGILRAGASGTTKREDTEKEHARLLQAKRIKVSEQIKAMNADMGKSKIVLDGYLIEDVSGKDLERYENIENRLTNATLKMMDVKDQNDTARENESTNDDGVNYYPCSVDGCQRINLSDNDYVSYILGELDTQKTKEWGANGNAD